jgi:hypothetical protein
MNLDDSALSNADSPPHSLVDNCGIPMLTQEQDTATEL